MDATGFDRLTRSLSRSGTRRGLLHLVAALPLSGALGALLTDASAGKGRREKRKARHHHDQNTRQDQRDDAHQQREHQQHKAQQKREKRREKNATPDPGCQPASKAQTCNGQCATVRNNCGTIIDCGPCACGTCVACTSCNPNTGRCDAAFEEQACGSPGQVCQVGICACKEGGCAEGQHCDGTACVCDDQSCATGCCDDAGTCHIDDNTACGIGGGVCISCTGQGQTCGGGVTPGQC